MGDRSFADSHSFMASLPQGFDNTVAKTHPVPAAAQIELFERNHCRWNGAENGRIRINIGPRGPQRCSEELLRRVVAAAGRYGCAVHTHVLETRAQAVTAQRDYGRSMIAYLANVGFLGPHLTINHGIWLTDEDIELLARHRCVVTHNPLSNLKLGSGICRVRDLLAAGITVALGTDGLATSDTADMVAVLRCATMLHSPMSTNYEHWVSAQEGFRMATWGGATSGLMGGELGRLAAGRKADITLLDRTHWSFVPLHDPVAQLTYSASPDAVRTVIVDGEIIMRDRTIVRVSEERIRETIIEAAERWQRDVKPLAIAAADAISPTMAAAYRDAIHAFDSEAWAEPLRRR
jgi:5-methylthioadenosine/S-adenosylhomocysteine deaminase